MALERQFQALLLKMLFEMGKVTDETPNAEIKRLIGTWKRLRDDSAKAAALTGLPGEAREFYENHIWNHPSWIHFRKVSLREWKTHPEYRKAQARYARKRRADPKINEEINRRRREAYAAKKAQEKAP